MRNSDSTKNWEHGLGVPVGKAPSSVLETRPELLIKSHVRGRRKRKENYDTLNTSVFMVQEHPRVGTWSMVQVFSGVRVAHLLLLLFMYDFNYLMFIVVYVCFPCLVFVPGFF